MDAKEKFQLVKTIVDRHVSAGRKTVPVTSIQAIVDAPEGEPYLEAKERQQEIWERERQQYGEQQADGREHAKIVIDLGHLALRTALMVNGGAAVALLAYLGQAVSTTQPRGPIAWALASETGGVVCAGLATGVTYLAQYAAVMGNREASATRRRIVITLVGASYVCFAAGCAVAARALA